MEVVYGTGYYASSSNINTAATHAGLVNVGEEANLRIKIIYLNGYYGTTKNGITSTTYNSYTPGFCFVDENGNEINSPGSVCATLSGYNVLTVNGKYDFANEGASIIPKNKGINNTYAESYIELDLTNYDKTDVIRLTLNAEISCGTNDNGFANIKDEAQNTYIILRKYRRNSRSKRLCKNS